MQIRVEHLTTIDQSLRPVELALKKLYLDHPELGLDLPQPMDAINDLLESVLHPESWPGLLRAIPESGFFAADSDVALVRHLRYLPVNYHRHAFFEIGCLLAGDCVNYVADQELAMVPGDICIIPPGIEHAVRVFSDDSMLLNILLRSSTFESAFSTIARSRDPISDFFIRGLRELPTQPFLYASTAEDPDVMGHIARVYDEGQREGRYQRGLLNSMVTSLLITLFDRHLVDTSADEAEDRAGALRVLRYLHQNLPTATLGGLAEHLGYSRRHVQRLLISEFGMSFSELLAILRMEQAADLIGYGVVPVDEVARLVGYSEVSSFRRAFKRFHGVTAGVYRVPESTEPPDRWR